MDVCHCVENMRPVIEQNEPKIHSTMRYLLVDMVCILFVYACAWFNPSKCENNRLHCKIYFEEMKRWRKKENHSQKHWSGKNRTMQPLRSFRFSGSMSCREASANGNKRIEPLNKNIFKRLNFSQFSSRNYYYFLKNFGSSNVRNIRL